MMMVRREIWVTVNVRRIAAAAAAAVAAATAVRRSIPVGGGVLGSGMRKLTLAALRGARKVGRSYLVVVVRAPGFAG